MLLTRKGLAWSLKAAPLVFVETAWYQGVSGARCAWAVWPLDPDGCLLPVLFG